MKRLDFQWVENTWTYVNKKRIPQSVRKNAEFYFIENYEEINNKNDVFFVTIINDNFSEEDLLNEYYIKFKFPYFGFNWDALLDCLRDLEWIKQKNIIVYHPQLPQLNKKNLKIYLEILSNVMESWKQWKEHNFEVYFNLKNYDKVQHIMNKYIFPRSP